jgi:hypothetical protein
MNRHSLSSSLALAGVLVAQAPPPAPVQPPIDLAICLDISGSMSGLLNAARQNLWAVVNDIARLQPAPSLRVALLTYGCTAHDAATGWVEVATGFTTDLDLVSQKLFALATNGGEEYVARVLQAANEQLDWSTDARALKLLFVCGNEAATQDPRVEFASQCRAAIQKGIVVNSIYCGNAADALAPAWREVAKLADGQFAAIEQDRTVVVTTPFDQRLVDLSAALNTTYVPYGCSGQAAAENQVVQDRNAAGMNVAAAATRGQAKGCSAYWNGHWDLVDACRDAKFKLEEVKREELPEALRKLDTAGLRAHVDSQRQKRESLQKEIEVLGRERDAFVRQELQKMAAGGQSVFEQVVRQCVLQQAEAKGFRPAPVPAAPTVPAVAPVGSVPPPARG